jgi:hypothetical protein
MIPWILSMKCAFQQTQGSPECAAPQVQVFFWKARHGLITVARLAHDHDDAAHHDKRQGPCVTREITHAATFCCLFFWRALLLIRINQNGRRPAPYGAHRNWTHTFCCHGNLRVLVVHFPRRATKALAPHTRIQVVNGQSRCRALSRLRSSRSYHRDLEPFRPPTVPLAIEIANKRPSRPSFACRVPGA